MSFDVEETAALLMDARGTLRRATLRHPPATIEDAYAVQDTVAGRVGAVGAWKVGAKAPGGPALAAPIFGKDVRTSPAAWPGTAFSMLGVEAEIAFRIGTDLAARAEPLADDEILAAVSSVHAAIEIVDSRLDGWPKVEPNSALADNQNNGALVYDSDGVAWSGQAFTDAPFRLLVDGGVVKEGRGGNPAGDPIPLLVWLVRHCCARRGGLKAGTIVTTGSFSGMDFVKPGQSVAAEFPGIGRAEVTFSG